MNDCPNADVRDLLPDLVHGRLDQATRAMVESHVADCADCRAELALLRDLRAATGRTPALNLGAIAAAVPAYRAPVRRSWVGWRTAAAVTLVVAGGSSIIVTRRIGHDLPDSAAVANPRAMEASSKPVPLKDSVIVGPAAVTSSPRDPAAVPSTGYSTLVVPKAMAKAPVERELAMSGGSLTDLSDRELTSLLKEIESLDALPSTDVESVPLSPIAPRRGTP
jgi:anti-sigma factor RsiW